VLGQSPPWGSYEIDEVRTVPLGADATALLYVGVGIAVVTNRRSWA
jgi:hypothetical protein